jgi:glucose-1-phosphate adenylyltransferase
MNLTDSAHSRTLARRTLALVLAGGRGSRLRDSPTPRQAGGAFRRQVPHHRLRAVELHELRHAPHRRDHAVQVALAAAPSAARLELPAQRDERVRRPAARAAAGGRGVLVPGTADAVYQNLDIIRNSKPPDYIVVLAGDHIYKMDYSIMLADHVESGRGVTVGCIEVSREEAKAFGVMAIDEQRHIVQFVEKPADPPAMPGNPDLALASMGIYVFSADYLYRLLEDDAADPESDHDFGKDLIPRAVAETRRSPTPSRCRRSPPRRTRGPYWRDVGTVDAYWAANLDLASTTPALNMYDGLADLDLPGAAAAGEVRAR